MLASTASSSEASRSDALPPMDDFVESDGFDTIPYPYSSDDDIRIRVAGFYLDGSGNQKSVEAAIESDGYFSLGVQHFFQLSFYVDSSTLPDPGVYTTYARIRQLHNDFFMFLGKPLIRIMAGGKYQRTISSELNSRFESDGTIFQTAGEIQIGYNTSTVEYVFPIIDGQNMDIGLDGYASVWFDMTNRQPELVSPDVSNGSGTADNVIANNSEHQVAQGNTIIELIKNTIQTISSQLTAFWNQLAGEFTNLYNKMNQQHSEQLEADRQNTDQVTGSIEKHGNFIIEGLKSLFIPSNDYFKQWFDGMYSFFNDRLGFLMLPVDLLKRLADMYMSAGSGSSGIPFPEFRWVDGTVIIPAQTVGFDFLETDWGKEVQDMLYFLGNVIMIGALLNLMHRKFEEVLRN